MLLQNSSKKKLLQTMQAKTHDTHLSILFVRATKIEMPGVHCHSACQPIEELATEPAAVVACMICDSPSIPAMLDMRPVRLAYQPPASSTFLSEQTSHQQPANNTFLSEQTSTSHQPNEQADD
jgi:hypothetical protein